MLSCTSFKICNYYYVLLLKPLVESIIALSIKITFNDKTREIKEIVKRQTCNTREYLIGTINIFKIKAMSSYEQYGGLLKAGGKGRFSHNCLFVLNLSALKGH